MDPAGRSWGPGQADVDLHLIPGAAASDAEREAVDAAIGADPTARHQLLPALHAAQRRVGYISEGALNHICARLGVPPAEAYGVASFYAMFALKPRAAKVVHVCDDIACRTRGAETICRSLEAQLGRPGEPAGGVATWVRSPCLGLCEHAPAALVQAAGIEPADYDLAPTTLDEILTTLTDRTASGLRLRRQPAGEAERVRPVSAPQTVEPPASGVRLLRRIRVVDPESLDDYRAQGGYAALRRALSIGPERILREVTESRLVGRGGAAFPTGRKWEAVARSPVRPHYLVCNADESEPGTFKDRVLMEEDPFALVEAMTIAGIATGCAQGFLYIRGEYPLATSRLTNAIGQARTRGLLGDDVMGEGVGFDIELRRGAGAYICGEETALFNSIEGLRGEPRNKPPFPVQSGLFHKPTVVNNVETLVNVLDIVMAGGPGFSSIGTAGSAGTKLFCVSGCSARPGLYEVPFGVTLRELIDLSGGVRDGRPLRAVLLGGAAGVFVTPEELDMPLTFEGTRAAGATLGSGVIMLFDDTIDLGDILLRIASFFRDESCGQCVPCRIGTIRQEEALHRLSAAPDAARMGSELALINEVAQVMRDASICGLGQTAASAVQSALQKLHVFPGGPR
jgi:NADH-quinone oxidoreductase subunit F